VSGRDDRLALLAELGLLSGSLSHELRQPLFAVKSLGQLLQARCPEGAELASQLLGQVAHLERLVQAHAVYLQDGNGPVAPVDPVAAVRQAMDLVSARARTRGLRVAFEPLGDLPAVRGRPTAVVQIVVNLLHNALLSCERGDSVDVRLRAGEQVTISVSDSGPGIPEALRDRVFERFFTTRPDGEGTGLGLPLSRQLARDMGGELSLQPSETGATFQLTLERWA